MRHTLLPAAELHKFNHEYRIRLFVVFLFMLSAAGVVGAVALTPAFMRSGIEEIQELRAVAAIPPNDQNGQIDAAKAELSSDESLASVLDANITGPRLSDLVQAIAAARGDSTISSFAVTRSSTSTVTVALQGASPTRDSFTAFKARIEESIPGTSVDIPLDELTQSIDVKFSITVTQTLP
jgi:hypothetical protein